MEAHAPGTILIVEDEALLAMNEQMILENAGYEVALSHSGRAAVDAVRENPTIDLVLMDIDLGEGTDGTTAARQILDIRELPVVFLTSHTEKEYVDSVKEITSYGYVIKDSGEFVLVESVNMAYQLFGAHARLKEKEAEAREMAERLMRYERIVRHTRELVSETDENDIFTFVNDRHRDVLGYDPEELVGTSPVELLHPEDLSRAVATHSTIRRDLGSSVDVWRFRHKNGDYRTFECRGSVYRDNAGRKSTITISHDITDRRRSEEAREAFEARFAAFMKHLPGAAFLKNAENRIVYCNDLYAGMLGTTPEALIDAYSNESLPRELKAQYEEENRRVIAEGEVLTVESTFPGDGEETHWLTYKFPVTLMEERLLGAISLNITERKKAQRALQATLQQKEHLMKELNHRVKNNLAMVASLISIKDANLGNTVDLSDLRNQVAAIRTVHETLEHTTGITTIPFRAYAEDLLSGVFSYIARKTVTVQNDIEDLAVPSKIATSLGLIINELATNAVKHGFSGPDDPRFTVSMHHDAGTNHYVLQVSNTGNPFPEEVGLESQQTLGLRLVCAMVNQLKGSVEIQRAPHPTFAIRVPAGP